MSVRPPLRQTWRNKKAPSTTAGHWGENQYCRLRPRPGELECSVDNARKSGRSQEMIVTWSAPEGAGSGPSPWPLAPGVGLKPSPRAVLRRRPRVR